MCNLTKQELCVLELVAKGLINKEIAQELNISIATTKAHLESIYKKLNAKNATTIESHKTVYRPWGCYTVLEEGEGFLSKCIAVNPDAKLSLQKHFHRSEHWIVLEGEATVVKGNDIYTLSAGESIDIGIEEVHSLQNFGKEQLKVLEIQQGDILDENDIVRLQDIYGRV